MNHGRNNIVEDVIIDLHQDAKKNAIQIHIVISFLFYIEIRYQRKTTN
jgi:hypothetical protein